MGKNVGFVSFRLSGTDGVSLETKKWAQVFERNGFNTFYLAGEVDTPAERSMVCEDMHFQTEEARELYNACFSRQTRPRRLTTEIHRIRSRIKDALYEFVERFAIDILIPENVITIPLNIPLGIAITEMVEETGINTIAHHHDFFWERKRFLRNCVWDYLNACYPPHLPSIQHVVINSSGRNQLALRTGIAATLIPNVMDFETPPDPMDEYARDARQALGIGEDELLILQPTRVVQRKGIEHAIELVARLDRPAALVISHASGDEGYEYEQRIREYAKLLEIRALFVEELIGEVRGTTADGRKIYSLEDIYRHADLVTYPSLFEGFGNAFLEAVYFKKPILVNNYSIYSHDIKPKGFDVVEMDDFISEATIEETRALLDDPVWIERMVEKNYALALRHFSYRNLEVKLIYLAKSFYGEEGHYANDGCE